ncbi:MAG: c-type cytochrome [Sulfurimonas sp.]|nr:c-type cytochrome [Sulfurimonas sp.]MBU1217928.1 c-type cytochrome [bacterium]MBU1434138.1 c-type cytochrome [bacterium]MBU1503119.1 c-type cytochrome [bacterium]MBU3938868.1 c-type cytochrome [bacterium]
MFKLLISLLIITFSYADEPIVPIPLNEPVNVEKAKLGKELFFDPALSRDNSTACVNCHNIYNGGADERIVSEGFNGAKGNIQSPTVLNARYNFKQFWNGRASNLLEQANGPLTNPAEHNMDSQKVELRVNSSEKYKKSFQAVYGVSYIKYALVLDAIVEFENALTTPNSKFDRYLRSQEELSKQEKEGYTLFKQYGCITCHNGINVGGNSFQKMGTFIAYNTNKKFPDKAAISNDERDINVFKVPTLRNISLTAPYFHDGSAKTLKEALTAMSKHNLGIKLSDEETAKIIAFLETLTGQRPKILDLF